MFQTHFSFHTYSWWFILLYVDIVDFFVAWNPKTYSLFVTTSFGVIFGPSCLVYYNVTNQNIFNILLLLLLSLSLAHHPFLRVYYRCWD